MKKAELFYFFEGLDELVLFLNDHIKDLKLQFIKISYEDFQKRFSRFFIKELNEKNKITASLSRGDKSIYENIHADFEQSIATSNLIDPYTLRSEGYIILLQDLSFEILVEGNGSLISSHVQTIVDYIHKFPALGDDEIKTNENEEIEELHITAFLYKLRLLGSGHLRHLSTFLLNEENGWIHSESLNLPIKFSWNNRYKINIDDTAMLKKRLVEELIIPPLLQLAFDSFNDVYEVHNEKVKFIVLMMALESIYNKSGDLPISHIISRHVALTLTNTKDEFEVLSKKVKELYDIRSLIVHGSTDKKRLEKLQLIITEKLEILNDIVRKVLEKLIWMYDFEMGEPTKDSLFNYLNSKGFSE